MAGVTEVLDVVDDAVNGTETDYYYDFYAAYYSHPKYLTAVLVGQIGFPLVLILGIPGKSWFVFISW